MFTVKLMHPSFASPESQHPSNQASTVGQHSQIDDTTGGEQTTSLSHTYVNVRLTPELPLSSFDTRSEAPLPARQLKVDETINNKLALTVSDLTQGEGEFGSVKMALPKTDSRVRPIRALKSTLNQIESKEIELLRQPEGAASRKYSQC